MNKYTVNVIRFLFFSENISSYSTDHMHKLFVSHFVKKFQNLKPKKEIYFFCNKHCWHFIKNVFKKLAKNKQTWHHKNAFCFQKYNSLSCYTCYFLLNVIPILFNFAVFMLY